MIRAALYARYSSHAQKDTSIEQQFEDLERYCKEKGYTIVARYADRAISGTTSDRPQFQKMLREARDFDVVVCWKVDRFARNREDAAMSRVVLKQHGTRVEYAMEKVEDTPEGALLEGLLESIAEFYSKSLSQNVRRGMMANFHEGKSTGGRPLYGYKFVDGRIVVDEVEAAVVREIFERYTKGDKLKDIIDDLNSRGLKTSNGNPWNKSSFKRMLRNEKYIGVYTFSGERIEGGYPRIIDDDVFQAAVARLDMNRHAGKRNYLLAGKIKCGLCGSSMPGVCAYNEQGVKYEYYRCRESLSGGCESRSAARSEIEGIVVGAVQGFMVEDGWIDEIAESCHSIIMQMREENTELHEADARIADLNRRIGNVERAIEQGALMAERHNELLMELSKAQEYRDSLPDIPEVPVEEIRDWLLGFCDGQIDDPAYQKLVVGTLVEEVVVYEDHVDVYFDASEKFAYCGRGGHLYPLYELTPLTSPGLAFGFGWFGIQVPR